MRARHRMSKRLLRRRPIHSASKSHWGGRPMQWPHELRFEDPASQATFDSDRLSIEQLGERMLQLENKIGEFGCLEPYREPVGWLRCFWGDRHGHRGQVLLAPIPQHETKGDPLSWQKEDRPTESEA